MNRALLALLLCTAGCVAPDRHAGDLQPGQWVEARGRIDAGKPVVTGIGQVPRTADDKPDKVELLGPVTDAKPTLVELLGVALKPDADTEYETADKQKTEPFVAAPGDWLRVKARSKDTGMRARTIRRSDPKSAFRVTGELRSYDDENDQVDIGGVKLPVTQEVDVGLGGNRNPDDPLSLFLADDQKSVPFTIVADEHLRFGGQFASTVDWRDDYELVPGRDRTKTTIEGKLDALWLIGDAGSYALFEVAGGRDDTFRQQPAKPDEHIDRLEVTRAFTSVHVADDLQLLAGRQDFIDERRWLYDEVLDGVRLMTAHGPLEFEAAVATGRAVAAENNPTEDTSLLEGNVRYHVDQDWRLTAYVLSRVDHTLLDHEPVLFGVRSYARKRYGLGHWVELGGATGHSTFLPDSGNPASRFEADLLGFAFDVGALWTIKAPLRPAFAAGYALGTGAGRNAKKQGYRQSGYNDNNGKMGGVTSVRYYGEILQPELSNIGIATFAATVRPADDASVTLLLHHYLQDTPTTFGPITDLRTQPNGRSPQLGVEADLVLAWRIQHRMTFELTTGHFEPGAAYDDKGPANRVEFTFRYSF